MANGIYNITRDLTMVRPLRISTQLRDAIVDTDTWVMIDKNDKVWWINHGFPKDLTKSELKDLIDAMAELYPEYTFEGDSYIQSSTTRKFTKYPSNYVKADRSIKSSRYDSYDESTPKAHWEARADFADGSSLEFNRPCTVTGWQNEDEQQYEIESDLLRRAAETGKEVVFYTVNFVLDE